MTTETIGLLVLAFFLVVIAFQLKSVSSDVRLCKAYVTVHHADLADARDRLFDVETKLGKDPMEEEDAASVYHCGCCGCNSNIFAAITVDYADLCYKVHYRCTTCGHEDIVTHSCKDFMLSAFKEVVATNPNDAGLKEIFENLKENEEFLIALTSGVMHEVNVIDENIVDTFIVKAKEGIEKGLVR